MHEHMVSQTTHAHAAFGHLGFYFSEFVDAKVRYNMHEFDERPKAGQ